SDWGLMFEAQNSFAVDTPVVHVTHDHCTLRSVYVNGNADNQAEYPTDDWEVSFNEQIGIFVQGDYVSLLRPRVEEVVTHGIKYSSCTGGLVENGYTFNTSWNGIHFTSGSTGCKAIGNEVTAYSDVGIGNYGDYNTISNNYVHDAYEITGSTNTQWGIGIEGGTHCLVSNNQLEDLALGIGVGGTTYHPDHWVIEGNVIVDIVNNTQEDSVGHYIMIGYGSGLVEGNFLDGIPLFSASNAWSVGIVCEAGSYDISVNDNTLGGTNYCGVMVDSQNDISITSNELNDQPNYPIYLKGACSGLVIDDNKIRDGARGITSDATGTISDTLITNNYMNSLSTSGIDIQNSNGLTILGGIIRDTLLAIDISSSNVVGCYISGVDLQGSTSGISDSGADVQYGTFINYEGYISKTQQISDYVITYSGGNYHLTGDDGQIVDSTSSLVVLLDQVPTYSSTWINLDGVHYVTSSWDTKSFQSWFGNGAGITFLERNGNYELMMCDETGGGSDNQENLIVRDMTLDGGSSASYTDDLIYIRSLKDSYFQNLCIKEFKGNGFYAEGVSGYNTFWVTWENIQFENSYSLQHTGSVIYLDRYAIDCKISNLWGGNGNGGVAGDYDESIILTIDDATDIVVDRIWGVRHKNTIEIISDTTWSGGCYFSDVWIDTNVEDAITITLDGYDAGGFTFDNIFVIPAFQSGYDIFMFNIGAGDFLSDVTVDTIHGTTSPAEYIFNKEGSGTLRRCYFNNIMITDGASGRYESIDYSDIGNDNRWDDNIYQVDTSTWSDPTWVGTPHDGETVTMYNSGQSPDTRIYTYSGGSWSYIE
ncbi:MAG: right-handed parallel beta-helix repeat-containing protein, partial [Candidatus Hodarchaeales archaeon]